MIGRLTRHRPFLRAVLAALVLALIVLIGRDVLGSKSSVQDEANRLCAQTAGCVGAVVTEDRLEGRVVGFTFRTGETVGLLFLYKAGEFVGMVPLD